MSEALCGQKFSQMPHLLFCYDTYTLNSVNLFFVNGRNFLNLWNKRLARNKEPTASDAFHWHDQCFIHTDILHTLKSQTAETFNFSTWVLYFPLQCYYIIKQFWLMESACVLIYKIVKLVSFHFKIQLVFRMLSSLLKCDLFQWHTKASWSSHEPICSDGHSFSSWQKVKILDVSSWIYNCHK